MKVELAKTFIPVTITLETQEEIDMLYNIVGNISGVGPYRIFADSIFYGLEKLPISRTKCELPFTHIPVLK